MWTTSFFNVSYFAPSYWPPATELETVVVWLLDATDAFVGGRLRSDAFETSAASLRSIFQAGQLAGDAQ